MNTGDVCIVTGANTGIGLETARELARTGATVVLACRNMDKAGAAEADIRASTGNEQVVAQQLDLASFESIRAFAATMQTKYDQIKLLVNNAGPAPRKLFLTADGFEGQFGVNHLGHFLLTNLLLPQIRKAAPSRIVVVSSTLHKRGKLDFDSFRGAKPYNFMRAYGQSKLANVLFTTELARRLDGSGVTVNAVHPGPIKTEIYRDFPQPLRAIITAPLQTPAQGARTTLHVALSPEGAEVSGRYFASRKQAKMSRRAADADLAARLWEVSEQFCAPLS